MPLIVANQRTPEWHAARKGKITASLAAACLGLDDYISRQKAWRIITGVEPETIVTDDMQRGIDREADAVYAWECATGLLAMPTGLWVHPDYPWLAASPDGLVDDDGVLDVKCPRKLHDDIPVKYRVQLVVQMACTERGIGYFGSWVEGQEPFTAQLCWNPNTEDEHLTALTEFYERYIVTNTPPERAKPRKAAHGFGQ
jgi:putative phage-type endonuclease